MSAVIIVKVLLIICIQRIHSMPCARIYLKDLTTAANYMQLAGIYQLQVCNNMRLDRFEVLFNDNRNNISDRSI